MVVRVELALLAGDAEQERRLRRRAQRLIGRQGVHRIGVGDQVEAARDRRLADAHGHLRVAERLGQVGDHGLAGLASAGDCAGAREGARDQAFDAGAAGDDHALTASRALKLAAPRRRSARPAGATANSALAGSSICRASRP